MKNTIKIFAASVGLALLAACSGGTDGDNDTPEPSETMTEGNDKTEEAPDVEEAPEAKSEKVIEIEDQPGSIEGYEGALKDAELLACDADGDGLKVTGTVENSGDSAGSYRIYVSALRDGDTFGIVQVDVTDVPAGASEEWSTQMDLPEDEYRCVLRVERFGN